MYWIGKGIIRNAKDCIWNTERIEGYWYVYKFFTHSDPLFFELKLKIFLDLGEPLHCFIVTGDLHPMEVEFLEKLKTVKN